MPPNTVTPSRRAVLRWAGAAATALAAPHLHATDVAAPGGRLRELLLMRGALDERLVIGTVTGTYYGVVDDEITPLFGVIGATFSRYRPLDDGSWLTVSFEHAHFTDPANQGVMTEWRNPFNGKSGPVAAMTSQPVARQIRADLSFQSLKAPPPGFTVEAQVVAAQEQAGDLVLVERVRSALARPAPAKPFRYSEIITMRASTAALRDPAARRVPCTLSHVNVVGWRPWMLMGDLPGHLMAQGSGFYGAELAHLPKVWLDATQRAAPDWLADPARRLEALFRG